MSKLFDYYHSPNTTKEHKLLPFWILRRIWKARNNLVFNQYRESPSKVALKAHAKTKEWINNAVTHASQPSGSHLSPRELNCWSKPESPYVKCNFDVGFNVISSHGRGGWIIRDHQGKANAWGSIDLNGATSPLIAEAKALLAAMQQTWIRGFTSVIFEGDI